MKQLTSTQKLIAGAVVIFIAIVHFGPEYLRMFVPTGAQASAKPSPMRYALPPVSAPVPVSPTVTATSSPEALAATKYAGVWLGNALMPDQNRCNIRLEIRVGDDKKLKGYEQKSCMPLQPLMGGKLRQGNIGEIIRSTSPVSAVMTGIPKDSGISFTVDQNIGAPPDGCALSGFSITNFGTGQIMAEWQEGTCPAGKMLLQKARG